MAEEASRSTMATLTVIIDASSSINKNPNNNNNINSHHHQPVELTEFPRSIAPSFLVRLHPGYFTITLSICSQALLWKMLSQHITISCGPNRLPWLAFHLLWWFAFCYLILLTLLYFLRCIFHFKMLKQELSNHVGLNYLFAPWISWLLLLQSLPLGSGFFVVRRTVLYHALWWPVVLPVILLDLKLYGQWFTSEKRFLSMAANPTSQMSIVANMVASWTASQMGWKESAVCIFAVGAAHYFVVFITLYQRLSGAVGNFPALLRPVFFLFVAAPCAACLAWSSILGTFSISCKLLFFLSLFLFVSLVSNESILIFADYFLIMFMPDHFAMKFAFFKACRPALFKKSMKRYNLGWWAYSFPLTLLALASSEYAGHIEGAVLGPGLTLILSAFSVLVFLALLISTALNGQTLVQENDPFLSLTSDCFRRTR